MAATTWDADTSSSTVVFSNGDLTATFPAPGPQPNALATRAVSGPSYWEVTVGSGFAGANTLAIGFAERSFNPSGGLIIGNSAGSFAYRQDGTYFGGSLFAPGGLPAYVPGNTIRVAVNPFTHFIWFAVNGGNWNNVAGADPAAGTGGIDISSLWIDVLSPAVAYQGSTSLAQSATAAFSTFAFTPPAGFLSPDVVQAVAHRSVRPAEVAVTRSLPAATVEALRSKAAISFSTPTGATIRIAPTDATPHAVTATVGGVLSSSVEGTSFPTLMVAARCLLPGTQYGSKTRQYTGPAGTTVSGIISEAGAPVAKLVRLYDRVTGEMLLETTSAADGTYSFDGMGRSSVYVVAFDDAGVYNAQIADGVHPS